MCAKNVPSPEELSRLREALWQYARLTPEDLERFRLPLVKAGSDWGYGSKNRADGWELLVPTGDGWAHRTVGPSDVSVLRADGEGHVVVVAGTPLDVIATWKLRNYRSRKGPRTRSESSVSRKTGDEVGAERDRDTIWVSLNSERCADLFVDRALRRAHQLAQNGPGATRLTVVLALDNTESGERVCALIREALAEQCEVYRFFSYYQPNPVRAWVRLHDVLAETRTKSRPGCTFPDSCV